MGLTSFLRYGIGEPEKYERNRPYYLMKRDGIYRHTSTGAMLIKEEHVGYGSVTVPGLKNGEEGVEYLLPKIPFKFWLMILDFYKAVNDQDGTEASAHIYYSEDDLNIPEELEDYKVGLLKQGNWIIYCPQQVNTSTLTEFGDDELYEWLIRNTIAVLETHSHNTMEAFWSSTDISNQQDAQYYGVYGRLGTEDTFLLKYVVNGKYKDIPVTDIVEFPLVKTVESVVGVGGYDVCDYDESDLKETVRPYSGVFKRKNEFPKEWLTDCHIVRSKRKKKKQEYIKAEDDVFKIGEDYGTNRKAKWYTEEEREDENDMEVEDENNGIVYDEDNVEEDEKQ